MHFCEWFRTDQLSWTVKNTTLQSITSSGTSLTSKEYPLNSQKKFDTASNTMRNLRSQLTSSAISLDVRNRFRSTQLSDLKRLYLWRHEGRLFLALFFSVMRQRFLPSSPRWGKEPLDCLPSSGAFTKVTHAFNIYSFEAPLGKLKETFWISFLTLESKNPERMELSAITTAE